LELNLTDRQNNTHHSSVLGYSCTTEYLVAHVPVNVSISTFGTTVMVDDSVFMKNSRPLDFSFFNGTLFDTLFSNEIGANHLVYGTLSLGRVSLPVFTGPAMALAATYGEDVNRIISDSNLTLEAQKLKQRFFGETLSAGLTNLGPGNYTESIGATTTVTATRLMAGLGVGISVGLLLLLLGSIAIEVLFASRPAQRPLHLRFDPSTSAAAALMVHGTIPLTCFENLDKVTNHELKQTLGGHVFELTEGKLVQGNTELVGVKGPSQINKVSRSKSEHHLRRAGILHATHTNHDWRPLTLRKWTGVLLGLFLTLIVATLVTIYIVAITKGLYQAGFIYQAAVHLTGSTYYLAPYSIIPTLVASIVSLWWGSIQDTFKSLTPFLAMANGAKVPSEGATLSYINTPIVWITGLAIKKRHWFLAVVTLGALFTQVLQVSMSAIWNRDMGVVTQNIVLHQDWEIRSISRAFADGISTSMEGTGVNQIRLLSALQSLYGGSNVYQSWLFSALVEISFNGSSPFWSKDTWGFPPVDLSHVLGELPASVLSSVSASSNSTNGPEVNATFVSTGLRGVAECTPISNHTYVATQDLTNSSNWNITRNPMTLQVGYELNDIRFGGLPINPDEPTPNSIIIGQWLPSTYNTTTKDVWAYNPQTDPINFTVIWVNAGYPTIYYDNGLRGHYIFGKAPQVQALNCMPYFEQANASITVNIQDGTIREYVLLDEPTNATAAWTDRATEHFNGEDTLIENKMAFNDTVSWGYLFQMAILSASGIVNLADFDDVSTPFSFNETDKYLDFPSYSALSISESPSSLLDPAYLTNITQQVFSTFFASFISLENGYDGYWAYQNFNASLPVGLDFNEQPYTTTYTSTSVYTILSYGSSYTYSPSIYTATEIGTQNGTTYTFTSTGTETYQHEIPYYSSTTTSVTTVTSVGYTTPASILSLLATPIPSATSQQVRRQVGKEPATTVNIPASSTSLQSSSSSSSSSILMSAAIPASTTLTATVHVRTFELIISRTAVFLSLGILIFLLISTLPIYILCKHHTRHLPRNVNTPGSLLAFVYSSARLQKWASEQDHIGIGWIRDRQALNAYKNKRSERSHQQKIVVGMGGFIGEDGTHRWGIEVGAHPEIDAEKWRESVDSFGHFAKDNLQLKIAEHELSEYKTVPLEESEAHASGFR
jgi:hypothetical protein